MAQWRSAQCHPVGSLSCTGRGSGAKGAETGMSLTSPGLGGGEGQCVSDPTVWARDLVAEVVGHGAEELRSNVSRSGLESESGLGSASGLGPGQVAGSGSSESTQDGGAQVAVIPFKPGEKVPVARERLASVITRSFGTAPTVRLPLTAVMPQKLTITTACSTAMLAAHGVYIYCSSLLSRLCTSTPLLYCLDVATPTPVLYCLGYATRGSVYGFKQGAESNHRCGN